MKRREFIQRGTLGTAGLALLQPRILRAGRMQDADERELAARALDAARSAGAGYADVRIQRNRTQSLGTRERQITDFEDAETYGFGVRVLADGAWGFAASSEVNAEEVVGVARQAVAQARANARTMTRPVELAPVEAFPDARWESPMRIDPFGVPVEEKVALLIQANEAALRVPRARFVNTSVFFVREEKVFASTAGSYIVQTLTRTFPVTTVTAVAEDGSDFQTRQSTDVPPRGLGYEYVVDADLPARAAVWAEEAAAKLSARPVEQGRYDLVLLPTHLRLIIHESIAHPTELDRIMGYEANYAGTSFIHPPQDFLGRFRYGPEIMNVQAERSAPGSLATTGWDDEGVRPDEYLIVKDGILNDLQTTREQAPMLADYYRRTGRPVRSHGNSTAESWAHVQFQRMPNVNLMPHPDRDVPLDELVAGVENGILIDGHGSFSIDQQRYNGQFGGQVAWEIRNGRRGEMLRDVAYQIRTPEFWNSMDLVGGPSTYWVGGTFFDGKGEPSQLNAVSHGSPCARFRQVNVINTGRRG
ncbi:MAG TPA: TldD/PmbA family protein [Longimicrobium sp.]|nr:TldD/PmbA family protein [Longimicrobium sp.]